MKKLIIAALLVIGVTAFAQDAKLPEKQPKEKMTVEQRNELQLKKMTLDLDLNAAQQKEIGKLIAERSMKRQAALEERQKNKDVKPTEDERFAKQKQMLDDKIAMKEKMKKILSPEQFEKWEKKNDYKRDGIKDGMDKQRKGGQKSEDK